MQGLRALVGRRAHLGQRARHGVPCVAQQHRAGPMQLRVQGEAAAQVRHGWAEWTAGARGSNQGGVQVRRATAGARGPEQLSVGGHPRAGAGREHGRTR